MKNRYSILLAAALAVGLNSCDSEARKEEKAARALAAEAQTNFDNGNYETAIALVDSIDKAYPAQVEVRRAEIPLRAKALKEFSEHKLVQTDHSSLCFRRPSANSQM